MYVSEEALKYMCLSHLCKFITDQNWIEQDRTELNDADLNRISSRKTERLLEIQWVRNIKRDGA